MKLVKANGCGSATYRMQQLQNSTSHQDDPGFALETFRWDFMVEQIRAVFALCKNLFWL